MKTKIRILVAAVLMIGLWFGAGQDVSARTPISLRLIGGISQTGNGALLNATDDVVPVFGAGVRYSFTNRHSICLDVERMDWNGTGYMKEEGYLTDFELSRDPLTTTTSELTLLPITLSYQYNLFGASQRFVSPFISAGASYTRLTLPPQASWYPSLSVSPTEEVSRDSRTSLWRFGFVAGLGCSARFTSWLSLSGTMSFRHLGLEEANLPTRPGRPDIQQNQNGVVVEGRGYVRIASDREVDGFEGRLILEFRL